MKHKTVARISANVFVLRATMATLQAPITIVMFANNFSMYLYESVARFTKLRKMNIHNYFAIFSYLFRMSADKLSYEKFTKELRKNYEKHTIDWRVTRELRIVYETFTKLFVTLS